MNSFDLQILDILKKSLDNKPISNIDNWPGVLNELKSQAVFCILYESIKKSECLSDEELNAYKLLCYQSIANNMQIMDEEKTMLELFKKEYVPVVILKGIAAAKYYPYPELRILGDIDIIVKPENYDFAFNLLKNNYQCIQTLAENPRHTEFIGKSGIVIELHKYFSYGEKNEKNTAFDQIIYAGIDKREWSQIGEHRFPCLPSIENGLVLLNHIYQHLQGNGIGLRQIIDFRQYVISEKEHIVDFLTIADKVGLKKLAEALIVIFNKYLGTNIEISTGNIDDSVVDELLLLCTQAGNFGRKEIMNEGKRSQVVLSKFKNPVSMMKTLQKNGRVHWKTSEKYAVLRPFAWIYPIGYYFKQVRTHGGLSVVAEGKNRLNRKEKLFKELGLVD